MKLGREGVLLSRVLLCEQLRPRGDSVEHTTELSYQRQGSRGTDAPMDSMSVKGSLLGTSLVVQWLRIRLTMQGMQVQSLVWALDPTCFRATKPQLERNPQPSTEDHMPGAGILQSYMPQLRPDTAKSIIFFKKEFSPGGIFPPHHPPAFPDGALSYEWRTLLGGATGDLGCTQEWPTEERPQNFRETTLKRKENIDRILISRFETILIEKLQVYNDTMGVPWWPGG